MPVTFSLCAGSGYVALGDVLEDNGKLLFNTQTCFLFVFYNVQGMQASICAKLIN